MKIGNKEINKGDIAMVTFDYFPPFKAKVINVYSHAIVVEVLDNKQVFDCEWDEVERIN
jgi:hypothetical protein